MVGEVVRCTICVGLFLLLNLSPVGAQSLQQARALSQQVEQLVRAGRYAEALPLAERAAGAFAEAGGPNGEGFAKALNTLALMYKELLRLDEAEATFDRSLVVITRVFGPDHLNVRTTLRNMAAIQLDRGRLGDCESTLRRALQSAERSRGVNSFDAASFLIGLGVVYLNMGRYDEAKAVYERTRNIMIAIGQRSGAGMASALQGLASVAKKQERWADAREHLENAYRIDTASAELQSRSYPIRSKAFDDLIGTLGDIAEADEKLGRISDAEAGYRRALAVAERELGSAHPSTIPTTSRLGSFLLRMGRAAEAEPILLRALSQNEALYGPDNLLAGQYIDSVADSLLAQGKTAAALAQVQRPAGARDRDKLVHLRVFHAAAAAGLLPKETAVARAFEAVQRGHVSLASASVASLAIRFAAGTDDLAKLVRAEQDLVADSEKLVRLLVEAASAEPHLRDAVAERQLRQQLDVIEAARRRHSLELAARFPRYAALSKPQYLTLEQVRGLLEPNETLIVFDIDTHSFAWAVSQTRTEWIALDLDSRQATETVTTLRQSLTFQRDLPFDLTAAHDLYQRLFGRLEAASVLEKRLLIVANGALTSLPFQLLARRQSNGGLETADWMVAGHAIGVLPSVASLAALRQAPAAVASAKASMIAFADPVFNSAPTLGSERGGPRASSNFPTISRFYKGEQVDLAELRRLQPLPGTRREVEAIARTMAGRDVELRLGLQATEAAVKRSVLERFRIVYFATHGLLAGEIKSVDRRRAEPALVLTVPDRASADDDGLLQASEIARLKLDAEWVVLSACNTASSQGPGAEALSGLAQAFFYAGARALIVSHWDVNDDGTAQLMADLFAIKEKEPSIGHLEAFQRAQLKMLAEAGTAMNRHPRYWAPFVVVGEVRGVR